MSTKSVASFITGTAYERLPPAVVTQTKLAIKDQLGVSLAANDDRGVVAARKVAVAVGGGQESTLIGTGTKVPCAMASMVNATMAAALDMDDGAYRSVGHLVHAGCVVVPTALAMMERQNGTGRDLIKAAVVGYEVTLRAGWLMRFLGFAAPSSTAGAYGAAAIASKALGLNVDKTVNALGIADTHATRPSAAKHPLGEMPMTKEGAGWGAMTGVMSALLSQAGMKGPRTVFDLEKYSKEPLASLGQGWETMGLYFKPYSSCRYTHAPVDGVLELMKRNSIQAKDISKVIVKVATQAAEEMAQRRPPDPWQAQFSLPFVIGAAIAYGQVGPDQVAETSLNDRSILREADKIALQGDPEIDALRPGMVPSRVMIETTGGSVYETYVPYPSGSTQNPLGREELENKFLRITAPVIGEHRAKDLSRCMDALEDLAGVAELVDRLRIR